MSLSHMTPDEKWNKEAEKHNKKVDKEFKKIKRLGVLRHKKFGENVFTYDKRNGKVWIISSPHDNYIDLSAYELDKVNDILHNQCNR